MAFAARGPVAPLRRAGRAAPARRVAVKAACAPKQNPFAYEVELTQGERILAGLPDAARWAAGAVLVAGSYAVGSNVTDTIIPKDEGTGRAGTVATVVGAGAAVGAGYLYTRAEGVRKRAAPKELRNSLVGRDDPTLTREEVEEVGMKYGVKSMGEEFPAELGGIYDVYLQGVLPPGGTPLEGWEGDALIRFKDALGIDDGTAAQVHMEVGRRLFRTRMELGDKDAEIDARREFSKLVFLSQYVFGEAKSKFLLPWKRVFDLTEAQVAVAVRDSAGKLYKAKLEELGAATAGREQLQEARAFQRQVLLADDDAADIWKAFAVEHVVELANTASEYVSQRTRARDLDVAKAELGKLLEYNRSLKQFEGDETVAAGVGPVNLFNSDVAESRMNDLKELFRMYLAENIKGGVYSDAVLADMDELKVTFGLGNKPVEEMTLDVTSRVYRMIIKKSLADGSLAAASSPAGFLQKTCQDLRFAPEGAGEINKEFYMTRLEEAMEDKVLDDKDMESLEECRKLLCVPPKTVKAAMVDTCGRVYRQAVERAVSAGAEGFDDALKETTVKAKEDMRLEDDVAIEILGDVSKKVFLNFIRESRSAGGTLEQGRVLRNMVFFNQQVVTPMVNSITGAQQEKAAKEIAEIMKEAQEMAKKEEEAEKAAAEAAKAAAEAEKPAEEAVVEAEVVERSAAESQGFAAKKEEEKEEAAPAEAPAEEAKAEAAAEEPAKEAEKPPEVQVQEEPKWQKTINLKDDLDPKQRSDLYKSYLMFCMTGDQVQGAMGSVLTVERDPREFTRLQQVGDILGMSPLETMQVQQGLAEQAYQSNAEQIIGGDATITKEKANQLDELQKQLQLPEATKEKVLKGIMSAKMARAAQSQVATGGLTLEELEAMSANGLNVDTSVSKDMRLQLYRKEVERLLTDGSGEFSADRMMKELPEKLKLDEEDAEKEVKKLGVGAKRNQLVQAVSFLRQKSKPEVVKALKNLVSCQVASPSQVDWKVREELLDLYSIFSLEVADQGKRDTLAATLGLTAEEVARLATIVDSGSFTLDREEDEVLF